MGGIFTRQEGRGIKDNNHTPQESLVNEKKFPKSIDLFLKTNSIDLTLFQTIPFPLSGDNS